MDGWACMHGSNCGNIFFLFFFFSGEGGIESPAICFLSLAMDDTSVALRIETNRIDQTNNFCVMTRALLRCDVCFAKCDAPI
jgi:hypothetical protein